MTINDKRRNLKRILEIRKAGKIPVVFARAFLRRHDGLYDADCGQPDIKPMTREEVDEWCDTHACIQGHSHVILEEFKEYPSDTETN